MNRPISEMVDTFFADIEQDSRTISEKNLRSWLWFTCNAELRDEVEAAIRADSRWKPALTVNGAWYLNALPEHLVLELPDSSLTMVRVSPFRQLTTADFGQYNGYHPRRCKGQPLPDYLYRFYGLKKSDETANEVIHVRLTPSEKATIQTAADNEGKTVSELVREWVRTL